MKKKDFPKSAFRSIGNQKHKNDQRPGARPPDAWDDNSFSREALAPLRHAARMKDLGLSQEDALKRLQKKWILTSASAIEIINKTWNS